LNRLWDHWINSLLLFMTQNFPWSLDVIKVCEKHIFMICNFFVWICNCIPFVRYVWLNANCTRLLWGNQCSQKIGYQSVNLSWRVPHGRKWWFSWRIRLVRNMLIFCVCQITWWSSIFCRLCKYVEQVNHVFLI
jgi:hypothetical protein